eukprot:scaffold1224_cov288-Chaetoceros_neogracile.AAC.12
MSSYEAAGLCGTTWLISAIHKNIAAFQRDQFHIGTVEESAKVHQLLKKIPVVAKYISYAAADMEVLEAAGVIA